MTVTRCSSSHLMTGLLAWRNPQGSEENWINSIWGQRIENSWQHAGKCISTEIGLGLLTITSAVETTAYATLALVSLTLYPFTDKPFTFFAKLLQRSAFTIIWGIADAILYNPFFINVMTHESYARYWAEMLNPTPMLLFRLDDRLYVADWAQQHRQGNVNNALLAPIVAAGRATQVLIDQGANFIQQDVLANANAETIDLFRNMDPSIYMFILTKAVHIYTAGAKKNDEVPDFFKPATKNLILALRQENNSEETGQELQRLVENPTQFETTPQGESAKAVFNRLRNIATGELQNSLLTTRCWQKAAEQLSAE